MPAILAMIRLARPLAGRLISASGPHHHHHSSMRNANVNLWLMTGQRAEQTGRRCEGRRRVSVTSLPSDVGLLPKLAWSNLFGTADRYPCSRAVGGSAAEPIAVNEPTPPQSPFFEPPALAGHMTRVGTASCTNYSVIGERHDRKYQCYEEREEHRQSSRENAAPFFID